MTSSISHIVQLMPLLLTISTSGAGPERSVLPATTNGHAQSRLVIYPAYECLRDLPSRGLEESEDCLRWLIREKKHILQSNDNRQLALGLAFQKSLDVALLYERYRVSAQVAGVKLHKHLPSVNYSASLFRDLWQASRLDNDALIARVLQSKGPLVSNVRESVHTGGSLAKALRNLSTADQQRRKEMVHNSRFHLVLGSVEDGDVLFIEVLSAMQRSRDCEIILQVLSQKNLEWTFSTFIKEIQKVLEMQKAYRFDDGKRETSRSIYSTFEHATRTNGSLYQTTLFMELGVFMNPADQRTKDAAAWLATGIVRRSLGASIRSHATGTMDERVARQADAFLELLRSRWSAGCQAAAPKATGRRALSTSVREKVRSSTVEIKTNASK